VLEPAVSATVELPRMREQDNVEQFLPLFEMALRVNKVPKRLWKAKLISHIPLELLVKVQAVMEDECGSYDNVVEALMGTSNLTYCAAAEDLMTGERGKLWEMEGRQAMARLRVLLGYITRDADTKPQLLDCIGVAMARDRLVPALKSYVDTSRRFQYEEFMGVCEEWERTQPIKTSWFKKNKPYQVPMGRTLGGGSPSVNKKTMSCFTCGKQGHMSRECRSRPQMEAVTTPTLMLCALDAGLRGINPLIALPVQRVIDVCRSQKENP